jgi:hypothetical protein
MGLRVFSGAARRLAPESFTSGHDGRVLTAAATAAARQVCASQHCGPPFRSEYVL